MINQFTSESAAELVLLSKIWRAVSFLSEFSGKTGAGSSSLFSFGLLSTSTDAFSAFSKLCTTSMVAFDKVVVAFNAASTGFASDGVSAVDKRTANRCQSCFISRLVIDKEKQ